MREAAGGFGSNFRNRVPAQPLAAAEAAAVPGMYPSLGSPSHPGKSASQAAVQAAAEAEEAEEAAAEAAEPRVERRTCKKR